MQFQKTQLNNGLEIIAEINEAAYSVSFGFFVNTGSRNETTEIAGISHFLEHIVFKGTENQTAEDVNRCLDEIGADANAFTTEEQTVFYASLLPELLNNAVELLGNLLRPALRQEDFETERQVILEEIRMYDDQPPFGADDKSRELFFAGHPLANSVLGTIESVSNLSIDQIRCYLEKRYCPENIVLIGAGRIDFDQFVQKAEQVCGHWKSQNTTTVTTGKITNAEKNESEWRRVRGHRGFHRIFKESATQQYTLLLSDAPSAQDVDRFTAGMIANMIGDDVGSRLYWELVDSGVADSAELGTNEFFDNGFFVTGLSSEPEYAEEVFRRTQKIYDETTQNSLTQEELNRSKNKILSRIVLANERPGGRLFSIGGDWTVHRQYRTIRQDLEEIRKITLDDVDSVLKKYPLNDHLLVTVGPLENFDCTL
ncbi:MAG: insulinase family protein [Planctomycetaceae bacterium]|jgi:predicted Zn-dependent peptidase|nr:insulinase family protein [Planctomycetaceae bacterium]